MGVKSQLTHAAKKEQAINFPALYIAVNAGHVVLFTSQSTGVLVHKGDSGWQVGHYTDSWNSCTRTEVWRRFQGRVDLENASEG